jgi:hypothetical protein
MKKNDKLPGFAGLRLNPRTIDCRRHHTPPLITEACFADALALGKPWPKANPNPRKYRD